MTGAAQHIQAPQTEKPRSVAAIVIACVVLALCLLVAADIAARAFAENQLRQGIVRNFPAGTTGDVNVQIGGASFLFQFLTGSMGEVTVVGKSLVVGGVPVELRVVADDVPFSVQRPIGHLTSIAALSDDAANYLVQLPNAAHVAFGDGVIDYTVNVDVLGVQVGSSATGTVAIDGPNLVMTLADMKLTATGSAAAATVALPAPPPISICAAQYLPAGMSVTSVVATPGRFAVTAEGSDLVFSQQTLSNRGVCP